MHLDELLFLSSYKYIQVLEMQADLKKNSRASKVNFMSQGMSNFAGYISIAHTFYLYWETINSLQSMHS